MTAPRSRLNTGSGIEAPIRPTTGALFFVTVLVALTLPVGVLVAIEDIGEELTALAAAGGLTFVALWNVCALVRRRAGSGGSLGAMTWKALVASFVLVVAAAGALVWWDYERGPEVDFLGADVLILVAAWAAMTFVVVSMLLSSVRASAYRVRAR